MNFWWGLGQFLGDSVLVESPVVAIAVTFFSCFDSFVQWWLFLFQSRVSFIFVIIKVTMTCNQSSVELGFHLRLMYVCLMYDQCRKLRSKPYSFVQWWLLCHSEVSYNFLMIIVTMTMHIEQLWAQNNSSLKLPPLSLSFATLPLLSFAWTIMFVKTSHHMWFFFQSQLNF